MERVTIRDVAKKAGVSITTVSKALNDYTDVNPDTRKHIQEIARQIQGVGPEHVILSTDFGQVKSPYSDEGMLGYMEALYACGVSEDALVQMTRTNPQRLIAS